MRIGIYDPYLSTLGGGENIVAVLAETLESLFPEANLDLITHQQGSAEPNALETRFGVRLSIARLRIIPELRTRFDRLLRIDLARRMVHERILTKLTAEYDLFFNVAIFSTSPSQAKQSVYVCMFPLDPGRPNPNWRYATYLPRLLNSALRRLYFKYALDTYTEVVAISRFTEEWLHCFYKKSSHLLYPPVAVCEDQPSTEKEPIILSVGRFFAGNHNKKHLPMIETFKKMVDNGLKGWEYHLVGGVADNHESKAYVEDLRRVATGYPIHFHLGASSAKLDALQARGSIFWHATGYGEDEVQTPDKMEHFGISTVEAMAHGIVPVVIGRGGATRGNRPRKGWLSLGIAGGA